MSLFAPSFAFEIIEARNWSRQIGEQLKNTIVLHDMEAPLAGTTARSVGHWFANQPPGKSGSSAHFGVDPVSVVQYVPAERIAWHAPGCNQSGIGVEHAGYRRLTRAEWLTADGRAMLRLSSLLTAELSRHFHIPPIRLSPEDLCAKRPGFARHQDVSLAFPHESAHTDPGEDFPYDFYLELVRGHLLGTSAEA